MRVTLVVFLFILLHGLIAWLSNQPQHVGPDVVQGKLGSLSYAPFREGQSPLQEIFPDPVQIDEDLRFLAQTTRAIRTYASDVRMGPIAKLASKHGLEVTQGAWLGYGDKDNRKEIAALIKAANNYPDVIKRVIVGNEVLLRGEMKPERLIAYIRQVKQAVKQPVSYADVWSMYMKYPQLIKEVDFITIHILPYWEDEPIPVDAAPLHIERAYKAVKQEAAALGYNKPIFIGESGWPSQGRQRGHAVPGVVNTARFMRGLIHIANENGFDYNIVEAFNQQWKSELEGVVGANWGLFSEQRRQVIPLVGQVIENPGWYKRWLLASLVVLIVVMIFRRRYHKLTIHKLLIYLGLVQLIVALLLITAYELWYSSYNVWTQMQTVFIIILNTLIAFLIMQRAYRVLANTASADRSGMRLYILYLLVTVIAVYKTYGLAEWGRYLSFPSALVYVPVSGVLGLFLIACLVERRITRHAFDVQRLFGAMTSNYSLNKAVGLALSVIGLAMLYGETRAFMLGRDMISAYPDFYTRLKLSLEFTLSNGQLLLWLSCLFVLALPFLFSSRKNAARYGTI